MKSKNIRHWIFAADLLWVLASLILAINLRYIGRAVPFISLEYLRTYSLMIFAALLTWAFLYFDMGLDGFKGGWALPAILSKTIVALCILMMAVSAVAFLTQHNYSRLVLLYFALLFGLGLIGIRCVVRSLLISYFKTAKDDRCLILGNGPIARELARKIDAHPELPFRVIGFLFPNESETSNAFMNVAPASIAYMKTLKVLDLIAQQGVKKLIIAIEQTNGTEIRNLIVQCRKALIQVYLVPQLYDLYLSRAELIEIDSLPLLSLQERNPALSNFGFKRTLDVLLSSGILLLFSPLLLLSALIVYRKKGKAFRAELRCGKDGLPFRMYRLNIDRHLISPAPYESLLIRWSLTELPQIWNVLRGDMSLVGPRPETPERVKHYSEWQRQRLKVRAGVTGLAQVHGLREQHSSEEKARFDLQYIFSASPFLDLGLILQTVWTLASRGLSREIAPLGAVTSATSQRVLPQEMADANRS